MARKRVKNHALELYGFSKNPELGKICRYIELTDEACMEKELFYDDLMPLFLLGKKSIFDCVVLSYSYGQAKGYRSCQQKRSFYEERSASN